MKLLRNVFLGVLSIGVVLCIVGLIFGGTMYVISGRHLIALPNVFETIQREVKQEWDETWRDVTHEFHELIPIMPTESHHGILKG